LPCGLAANTALLVNPAAIGSAKVVKLASSTKRIRSRLRCPGVAVDPGLLGNMPHSILWLASPRETAAAGKQCSANSLPASYGRHRGLNTEGSVSPVAPRTA
jgi:hypothetical protein